MPNTPNVLAVPGPGADADLPPGQHLTTDFPVVSTSRPPHIVLPRWTLTISADTGWTRSWDWAAFRALRSEEFCVDLHSVLGWSKVATNWAGVPVCALLDGVPSTAEYALVRTYGDYTTSVPMEDLLEMPTWIAHGYEGRAIPLEHGGPARLLIPHLYLYKSAKWVRAITLSDHDQPGTRERGGLHPYGDPWRDQRFQDS